MRTGWPLAVVLIAAVGGCSSDLNLKGYTFACDSDSDCASGKVCDTDSKICVLKAVDPSDADTADTPGTDTEVINTGCVDPAQLSAPVWKGDLAVSDLQPNSIIIGWGPAIVDIACLHKVTYLVCVQLTLESEACAFKQVAAAGETSAMLTGLLESRSYRIQMKACTAPDHCSDWSPVLTALTQTTHATWEASVGEDHACAVLVDGTVRCWGNLNNNKLGNGKSGGWTTTPGSVLGVGGQPLTGVVQVTTGANHSCARRADGLIQCWGVLNVGSPPEVRWSAEQADVVSSLEGVIDIDAGQNHVCAVNAEGSLYCWGDNVQGQLGHLPETLPHLYSIGPTQVLQLPAMQAVTAGARHTCGLSAGSGDVYCWGDNEQGQVGREKSTEAPFIRGPLLVGEGDPERKAVIAIAAGHFHTCGIRDDGTLWCWGAPGYKALGDLPQKVNQLPLVLDLNAGSWVDQLSAGFGFNCVRNSNYQLECWGANGTAQSGSSATSASQWPPIQPSFGEVPPARIAAGLSSACAIAHNGVNRCWGANNLGQLGYDTAEDVDGVPGSDSKPQKVQGLSAALGAISIAAAHDATCAVLVDGSLRCWGDTLLGDEQEEPGAGQGFGAITLSVGLASQFGCVHKSQEDGPAKIDCLAEPYSEVVQSLGGTDLRLETLTSNDEMVCGITKSGVLKCVAVGTAESWDLSAFDSARFVEVSLGDTYGCGLTSRGTVEHWGDQTGLTEKPGTLRAKSLSVKGKRICAVTDDGGVVCWGNIMGEMSDQLLDLSKVRRVLNIALQGKGYCLLFSDGAVECASDDAAAIKEVVPSDAVSLVSGRAHSCALLVDGTVTCWGDNTADRRAAPIPSVPIQRHFPWSIRRQTG